MGDFKQDHCSRSFRKSQSHTQKNTKIQGQIHIKKIKKMQGEHLEKIKCYHTLYDTYN